LGVLRPRLTGADLAVPLLGAALTVVAAFMAVRMGAALSVGPLVVVCVLVGFVIGFIAYPHIAIAVTVVLFALVPTLKVLVLPELGALKDLIAVAAVAAAVILFVIERRRPDRWVLLAVAVLLALYVVNAGGGHDIAWLQGVRLVGEPLLLLLVGLMLPQPQRTFRYAMGALVIVACLVSAYGIFQQAVGPFTLVSWGYSFDEQVRSLPTGELRSFGTLDDPFAYAGLLVFGLVGVAFWLRRGPIAWGAGILILIGLGFSYVRTALLVLVALAGLQLSRWGYAVPALLVVTATAVAGGLILANATGTQAHTYGVSNPSASAGAESTANVVLNGRISAWEAALGTEPSEWLLGRGVGEVGTAAARASYSVVPTGELEEDDAQAQAVDSGYLATIAEVGFVGLAVLLALFARLGSLSLDAARKGSTAGWVALALLTTLLLDAVTRATFTGFPTAFLGLLLVGIALAAAREESDSASAGV